MHVQKKLSYYHVTILAQVNVHVPHVKSGKMVKVVFKLKVILGLVTG